MRTRAWTVLVALSMVVVAGPAAIAQSPVPSARPTLECGVATELRFPIHDAGATLVTPFAFADPALPNPDPSFAGRFHPAETWTLPEAPDHRAVYAAGPGRVLATGTIGTGDRGGIVVVEHTGPFVLPASAPDDPYVHPETPTGTLLTVYAGIDPAGIVVGDCVTSETLLGLTTARCGAGVDPPCSDLPAALRFEVRLGSLADPALHSADWSVAGPASDSIGGTFLHPQVMVDDGLRDPSRVIAALSAPCPGPWVGPSASPSGSPGPCEPPVPVPSASPVPTLSLPPTPTPAPTPRPVVSPRTAIRQGIPRGLRASCEPRTTRLITGTLAAYDCRPDDPRIEQVAYFLGRPADVRFTLNSRAREQGLRPGADCATGVEGIESRRPGFAFVCYSDEQGRANLRATISDSCPGVYIGVLGTGSDVGALMAAWQEVTGGSPWSTPSGTVAACRKDKGDVSAPPIPSKTHYKVSLGQKPTKADPAGLLRVTVTWSSAVTADTTIEVYGIDRCLATPPKNGSVPCVGPGTRIPSDALVLLRTAPADTGSVSWLVQNPEIFGGAAYYDKEHGWIDSIVVRARNSRAASAFAFPPEGRGEICDDCVY